MSRHSVIRTSLSSPRFEIERYEQQNQTGSDCVMARYSANIDGSVEVRNSGWTAGGQFVEFVGRATVASPMKTPCPWNWKSTSHQDVSFNWKFILTVLIIFVAFLKQNLTQSTGTRNRLHQLRSRLVMHWIESLNIKRTSLDSFTWSYIATTITRFNW